MKLKRTLLLLFIIVVSLFIFSCKSGYKFSQSGSFEIINYSEKIIEFIWIAPEGEFYPTSREVNVGYGQNFEMTNLEPGLYDIAIDFKGEYNSFNSKKNKSLLLNIEKGVKKIWVVNSSGEIVRN